MSDISAGLPTAGANNPDQRHAKRTSAALFALVATAIAVIVQFAGGVAQVQWLADDGMRLVQVRDLIAGQSWFDTMQYRLGPDGGTLMHWSRLIDAPIALLVIGINALTGDLALAERVAAYIWPASLMFLGLWAIARAAHVAGSDAATGTAVAIGALTFVLLPEFQPGGFDHHGAQIVLGLWTVACLLDREDLYQTYALAGVLTVLMLAIGMETLPYVAAIGVWVAVAFWLGFIKPKPARAFGLALPVAGLLIFVLTVSPDRYAAGSCDAYSLFHLTMASVGGVGLAVATLIGAASINRLVALGSTAAVLLALAFTVFQPCIATPLASLHPMMERYWLDTIIEAQSIVEVWKQQAALVLGYLGLPVFALLVAVPAWLLREPSDDARVAASLYALLLITTVAVSLWQVRASVFALAFALVPMALLVVGARKRYERSRSFGALGGLVAAWMVSFSALWWVPSAATQSTAGSDLAGDIGLSQCFQADDIAYLATIPSFSGTPVMLAARFDAAVPLLLGTGHRVLTGNYHRNAPGNLAWISMMMAAPEEAAVIARRNEVTHIVDCAGAWEGDVFAADAPNGLQASLNAGNVPDWLMPLPSDHESQLKVYEVKTEAP